MQKDKAQKEHDTNIKLGWVVDATNGTYYPYKRENPVSAIEAGSYEISVHPMRGIYFKRKEIVTDRLVLVEGSPAEQVLREVEAFVARRNEFIKRGFLHKRGIMLVGIPGSGKTSTINVVAHTIASAMDGLTVYLPDPDLATAGLQKLREIEPKRLVLGVIEDVDRVIERHDEEELLSLLDGENQIDNVLYIATTNYPEELPERLWDRPSRFDTILEVGVPNQNMRAEFLREKEPEFTDQEISLAVKHTEGFTVSHLKELIVLTKCFGHGIEQAAKRIHDTRNNALFKKKEEK